MSKSAYSPEMRERNLGEHILAHVGDEGPHSEKNNPHVHEGFWDKEKIPRVTTHRPRDGF
jgi:hypothetical protein